MFLSNDLLENQFILYFDFCQYSFNLLIDTDTKRSSLYRLTLFIASSSFIILTLISIISFVSCFILCNEGKDMNVAQRSLIHSMSSSSALNLMAATATHNQLNQINLDHNYFERELRDPLEDELQVCFTSSSQHSKAQLGESW